MIRPETLKELGKKPQGMKRFFLSFTFKEETRNEKMDWTLKIKKVSDKPGKDICNTHDKHSYI